MAATAAAAVYATISRGRMPRMEGPPSHPNFRSNTVNGKVRRSGSGKRRQLPFISRSSLDSRGCCVAAKLCLGLLKSQLHDHRQRTEGTDGLVFSPIVV